ncbi:apical endosomal glycoprotein, partial [Clarias magur]
HFLYVTKPDVLQRDWASFQSPNLEPTSSSQPCRLVMYTHQFGGISGGLSVLVAERNIYPVWERGGSLGDLWVKAEIEFVVNSPFQILFVAAIRDQAYGGIAVDDITLSPDCRLSNGSVPPEYFPKPPKKPCAEASKICDFNLDCTNRDDEVQCGDFSYEQGSKGWTDTSIGIQGWRLMNDTSTTDVFLYVAKAAGQQRTEAQTRTPLLGPSGPACTLNFFYSLTGNNTHIGEISVIVVDSVLGFLPRLWEFAGRTGENQSESWIKEEVYIGARDHRFQLVIEAVRSGFDGQVAIDDVAFVKGSCSLPTMCSFEGQRCGYTNNRDGLWVHQSWDATRTGPKTDHSLETEMGYYMLVHSGVDVLPQGSVTTLTSPVRRGLTHTECVYFWYNMGGHNPGTLSVYVKPAHGERILLFSSSINQGHIWRHGMGNVSWPGDWQLQFEVGGGGGKDTYFAIDDIGFSTHSCPTTDDSKLVVQTFSNWTKTELLSLTEAGATWMHYKLDVISETEYQIVFEGLKGVKGALALDDIGYTVGVNCAGEQTDQITSTSPNNTGVIVASVVVAILLMGTLTVLLFLYLRMRNQRQSLTQDLSGDVTYTGFNNDVYESDHVTLPSVFNP